MIKGWITAWESATTGSSFNSWHSCACTCARYSRAACWSCSSCRRSSRRTASRPYRSWASSSCSSFPSVAYSSFTLCSWARDAPPTSTSLASTRAWTFSRADAVLTLSTCFAPRWCPGIHHTDLYLTVIYAKTLWKIWLRYKGLFETFR